MAARLACLLETEKAVLNWPFYFRAGVCQDGARCCVPQIRSTTSPTLSVSGMHQRSNMATPAMNLQRQIAEPQRPQGHVEDSNGDRFQELGKSGEQESLGIYENLDDQMGSVAHSSKSILVGLRAEEMLGFGLMAGVLLFPEQSSAVDMLTVAATTSEASQGLMSWANNEPANALSLPTWIIHVASVAEWATAMSLVWKYGDTPGKSAWKGLTWGMVPLLGGAMCACTWHFFYNSPSLEVLVVLQASLTVVGNFTMWIAAYRIWKASQEKASVK
ncbi:hypothetical protein R1sor_014377 [Riccia sorocarpa]|uniref:Ycf49-like protein n=1 Tax=Riccia sorocarpa TaxID=122646 RepID=A0ABD3H981_9MARC